MRSHFQERGVPSGSAPSRSKSEGGGRVSSVTWLSSSGARSAASASNRRSSPAPRRQRGAMLGARRVPIDAALGEERVVIAEDLGQRVERAQRVGVAVFARAGRGEPILAGEDVRRDLAGVMDGEAIGAARAVDGGAIESHLEERRRAALFAGRRRRRRAASASSLERRLRGASRRRRCARRPVGSSAGSLEGDRAGAAGLVHQRGDAARRVATEERRDVGHGRATGDDGVEEVAVEAPQLAARAAAAAGSRAGRRARGRFRPPRRSSPRRARRCGSGRRSRRGCRGPTPRRRPRPPGPRPVGRSAAGSLRSALRARPRPRRSALDAARNRGRAWPRGASRRGRPPAESARRGRSRSSVRPSPRRRAARRSRSRRRGPADPRLRRWRRQPSAGCAIAGGAPSLDSMPSILPPRAPDRRRAPSTRTASDPASSTARRSRCRARADRSDPRTARGRRGSPACHRRVPPCADRDASRPRSRDRSRWARRWRARLPARAAGASVAPGRRSGAGAGASAPDRRASR